MDRDFMRSFCKNYYSDFESTAVVGCDDYLEKRSQRYKEEKELVLRLQEDGKEIIELFEKYLDACADEKEVLMEEVYLLGAEDREKMLRGII